jgi:glycosyltransferase involved in cell wall biosynthesis
VRILHVAETAKGGVGTYLDELIPIQTAKLGIDCVMAIVPRDHRHQLAAVSDDQLRLLGRHRRSIGSLLNLRRQIRSAVREHRPDIVHLHSTFAGAIGRLAIGAGGAKIIYSPHGWPFEMWRGGAKKRAAALAERLLASRCDRIVAVSEAERRQGTDAGVPSGKIAVVLSGIAGEGSAAAPASWLDERLKVLFVGRLDRQKGIDTLVRIVSSHPSRMVLRVIGDAVVSRDQRQSSQGNVDYLGWLDRTEISAQLQACDVLAMPSRWEALGITALEAARAGKPTVAFAVGGLPEVIEDGVTGRLVPADDEAAFGDVLLSEPPGGWSAMGSAARRRFERLFRADRMADQLFAVYANA